MKQRNQIILLAVLLVAMGLVWYVNRSKPAVSAGNTAAVQNYQLLAVENPQLHRDKMEAAQKAEYHSSGRNPFSEIAAARPEPAVKKVNVPQNYGPVQPPPPPPPTLPPNMKFFGYGTVPNGTSRRAFLSDGEEVYILAEGDTLLGRYRIVKVNNGNVEFEEISSGRRNTVPLTQDEQGAPPA
ncbi:MAG: hypothetical protein M3N22_06775 [Acidobacteriota bacterium]|nr:hypothetical protein [Acidobacteriota bacterium]